MVPGSLRPPRRCSLCALAPGRIGFAIGVLAMQLASCFVLYSTAFVAIVQFGGRDAQRSITHLTLIAGFASTLFWPLTTTLHEHFGWREVLADLRRAQSRAVPADPRMARAPVATHVDGRTERHAPPPTAPARACSHRRAGRPSFS